MQPKHWPRLTAWFLLPHGRMNGPYRAPATLRTLAAPGPCSSNVLQLCVRARSEPGGTWRRTGGEVKGKLANGVGSQYSHATSEHGLYPALLKLMRTPRLPAVDWTDAPTYLNGLVRFGERRNLVSAHMPSRSARAIPHSLTRDLPWKPHPSRIGTCITYLFFFKPICHVFSSIYLPT